MGQKGFLDIGGFATFLATINLKSYAQSFMFAGNYEDLSKRAEDGSIMTQICAMDATVAFSLPPGGQYEKECMSACQNIN